MQEDFVPPGFGMVAGRVTDPLLTLQHTRGEGSFPAIPIRWVVLAVLIPQQITLMSSCRSLAALDF